MKFRSILIAANNYPTTTDPVMTFVEQLVIAMSKKGVKVTVIAPFRIVQHYVRGTELHPRVRKIEVDGGEPITVVQPRYITLGGRFEKFNLWSAKRAVCKAAKRLEEKPDVCYGYFWHWAYSLYPFACKNHIPLFSNTSETPILLTDIYPANDISGFIRYVKGVVCASSYCRDQSVERELTTANECMVIPNAIDNKLFLQKNRESLRRERGFSLSDFIVAYTGWYSPKKGYDRLSQAITKLNDSHIKSFFIGDDRGEGNQPTCEGILHRGRLPHNVIPDWLNMADIFVLPTLHEGCCNAIIEAMACGLPIVSSNLPFNWDVLNDNNSILINPMNIDEIAEAIRILKEDPVKRDAMSKASLETASNLTIDKRVDKIFSFIESKL